MNRPCIRWITLLAPILMACGDDGVAAGDLTLVKLEFVPLSSPAAIVGNVVAPASVQVLASDGRPIRDVVVRFHLEGRGMLAAPVSLSDADGLASPGGWRLGPDPGTQRLVAEAGGLTATLAVEAVAAPPSQFDIALRLVNEAAVDPDVRWAIEAAVARWEALILGDLPDAAVPASLTTGCPPVAEPRGTQVDDLMLLVEVSHIDGAAATTKLCARRATSGLPFIAYIRIDLEKANALDGVEEEMAHEIGHALGIGTIWSAQLADHGGDLRFTGPNAGAAYRLATMGADSLARWGVPVQMEGGPAVARTHWRESALRTELLTPFVNPGLQPLSAITIAALRDLGYMVDDGRADPWPL